MDYKYIEQLMERYWEAETSLEEEQILRSFFSQHDVPAELAEYADYFRSLEVERHEELGSDFDKRVLARIGQADEAPASRKVVEAHRITLGMRLRPLFRAAAVVAICLWMGGSIQHAMQISEEKENAVLAEQTDSAVREMQMQTVESIQEGIRTAIATDTVSSEEKTSLHY